MPEQQVIAHKRMYATADGRLVDEGDPEAATLVAAEGQVIRQALARRLGLSMEGNKVVQKRPEGGEREEPESRPASVTRPAEPEPEPKKK
jgi:hypothetical protein